MEQDLVRHCIVLKPTETAVNAYFHSDEALAREKLRKYIAEKLGGSFLEDPRFDIAAQPCRQVHLDGPRQPSKRAGVHEMVVGLQIRAEAVNRLVAAVADPGNQAIFSGSSPDLPLGTGDHWCPGGVAESVFATRSAAEQLLGIDFLREQKNTTGKGVNVVVADQGLNKEILGKRYGGGWAVGNARPGLAQPEPGSLRRPHGMMIAHNILKVAPEVTLFDLPLAPVKVSDEGSLGLAISAYKQMLADIAEWRTGKWPGPWILVNPWGVFDRKSETPKGHYTENPNSPLNREVRRAVEQKIDVVFVAGNCGQFCPDERCGPTDQGPGHSIWGANSLEAVLTVGAVRADATWLGYSSQGPGQKDLGPRKPDLCAASQFCDDDDAFSTNTGTSTACALTAGVIAALRSRWDSNTVPPPALKDILNGSTTKPAGLEGGKGFSNRFGNGILNARVAFEKLSASVRPLKA